MTSARWLGQLVRAAGGEAAEEHPVAVEAGAVEVEAVHPDPVAEQRAAALAAGRVDGEHGDPHLVVLVHPQSPDQLVGERALAAAAGAGDAEHGDAPAAAASADPGERGVVDRSGLDAGDHPGQRRAVTRQQLVGGRAAQRPQVVVAVADDGVDHPRQAHPLPVLGREDRDAGPAQPLDLVVHDHAAATADDLDVAGAAAAELLDEVLEVLDVAALVRRHRHALHVLLDRRLDDLGDRAVVAEVDHLAALGLEDPPHDVDRRVVPVEQARRGHQPDRVRGLVERRADHGHLN